MFGWAQSEASDSGPGFAVDARVCQAGKDGTAAAWELLQRADAVIAATHGLAGPIIAAFVAMGGAWLLRLGWRGISDAPIAVVAVALAGIVGAVVALWPGQHSCRMPWVALLAMPLGVMVAGSVLVGCWRIPRLPRVAKVGLAAMVAGIALNLVLARSALDNAAAFHLAVAALVACGGMVGLAISEARVSAPRRSLGASPMFGTAADAGDQCPGESSPPAARPLPSTEPTKRQGGNPGCNDRG